MNWLEVSLSVNGELAEAVADVFARYAPNGVATEQGVKFVDEVDQGTAAGPITVCAYLPVDDQLEDSRRKIEEALAHLRMIQPIPSPAERLIPDQNWMEAWKQHYQPIPIGRRLIVLPAWLDHTQTDRIAVRIDPGMAFGTGTHPTTQLCLEFLESLLGPAQPASSAWPHDSVHVIDVGCGSGILSISALKLGAAAALGVDIDPEAIENARRNARINSVGRELDLAVGSIEDILHGGFSMRKAQCVVVNILAPVIVGLFDTGLADLMTPGGTIILSGILEAQTPDVIRAAESHGLMLRERRQSADWVAILMES